MSSFNRIEKIKYTEDAEEVVSLLEYIVFANERAEKKYLVFKFVNNVNQQLLGMEFEVSQFDAADELIEKSVVIYNDFLSKANKTFVPQAKLLVNYDCSHITVRLIKAAFDRVIWKEGEFLDNSYKFEHYVRDEQYIEAVNGLNASAEKTATQKPSDRKSERSDVPFKLKNITRKNIARFPAVFSWIVCILIIAFVVASLFLFKANTDKITIDGYALRIIDKDSKLVSVYGYEGDDVLEIPAQIDGYTVTRIESGAFVKSKIKAVSFTESIIVEEGAFQDCKRLVVISMPKALLNQTCFQGCSSVSALTFGETYVKKLVELFGEEKHSVPFTLFDCAMTEQLTPEFFDGISFA